MPGISGSSNRACNKSKTNETHQDERGDQEQQVTICLTHKWLSAFFLSSFRQHPSKDIHGTVL